MRIQNDFRFQPLPPVRTPEPAATTSTRPAFSVDSFEGKASAVTAQPQQAQASSALASALQTAVVELVQKLVAMLQQLLNRGQVSTGGQQPGGVSIGGGAPTVTPTPLRQGNAPGQVEYDNTIQNPHIAPRSTYRDVVNSAIDKVRAQHIGIDPENPDRITNYATFHNAVVSELRSRGYNAAYDGEELAINSPGDNHSEQFDISTSTMLVRRFYSAWISPPVFAE